MKPPLKRFGQDEYAYRWQDECVDISLDEIHEARGGELRALMTVKTDRDGHEALLFQADFNLVSTTTRQAVVRSLAARAADLDWGVMLEAVCYYSRERWREGDPLLYLPDIPEEAGERFLVKPYLERGGPTVIFAMGGTGKSFFAAALALSLGSGQNVGLGMPAMQTRVCYLDWETDGGTHKTRMRALCASADIPFDDCGVFYRHQSASLAASAASLRKNFAKQGIGFMIVDSLGAARGGEPESADSTIRLFNAARSIGVPWLGIDHMTKNGGADQTTPFGSVYTTNLARQTWALEVVEPLAGGRQTIALTNRKANNGPSAGRRAFEMTYEGGDDLTALRYRPVDPTTIAALVPKLSLEQRIYRVLRDYGPLTVADICTRDGVEDNPLLPASVTNALRYNPGKFVQNTSQRPARWGLLSTVFSENPG